MININAERDAFEAWLPAIRNTNVKLAKFRDGTYQATATQSAWMAWQARAALPPAAQLRNADEFEVGLKFPDGRVVWGRPVPDKA